MYWCILEAAEWTENCDTGSNACILLGFDAWLFDSSFLLMCTLSGCSSDISSNLVSATQAGNLDWVPGLLASPLAQPWLLWAYIHAHTHIISERIHGLRKKQSAKCEHLAQCLRPRLCTGVPWLQAPDLLSALGFQGCALQEAAGAFKYSGPGHPCGSRSLALPCILWTPDKWPSKDICFSLSKKVKIKIKKQSKIASLCIIRHRSKQFTNSCLHLFLSTTPWLSHLRDKEAETSRNLLKVTEILSGSAGN